MHQSHMLINGEQVISLSGKVEIIRSPANQEPVSEVRGLPPGNLPAGGQGAFPSGAICQSCGSSALASGGRGEQIARLLLWARQALNAGMESFFRRISWLPREEARETLARWISSLHSQHRAPAAVGVAALITPWNFPWILAWKVAPCLAAGCLRGKPA
jgi:hypothetical protein